MYKHVKRVTEWGSRPLRSAQFRKRENGGEEWMVDDELQEGVAGRLGLVVEGSLQQDAGSRCELQGVQCGPVVQPSPGQVPEHVPSVSNCAKMSVSGN